jgi:hypothetical protein
MTHEIRKCSCGALIGQCRCLGPKPTVIVQNGCSACQQGIRPASHTNDAAAAAQTLAAMRPEQV